VIQAQSTAAAHLAKIPQTRAPRPDKGEKPAAGDKLAIHTDKNGMITK